MTEAFDGWFDSNFLDPDGGASHLPDWFRGDMQKAWDAGRAAQAPTNRQLHDAIASAVTHRTYSGIQDAVREIQKLYGSPVPSAHRGGGK